MIPLDGETLRRLQRAELSLLLEADRICRKYGIHYNIIAGTMLGAVRHGGFIPWDDDADIAMLRGEYERFREACRTELVGSRFCFQDHTVTPGYRWGYGKLRLRETLFLREHQAHMPYVQGIFIDVFPLDAVPESRAGRALENARCFIVRKLLWARVGRYAAKSAFRRAVFALMDRVPEAWTLRRLDAAIRRAGRRRSGWVRILTFPTPNRQYGYRASWYEGETPVRFEGRLFPGVADPDAYLRFKYGEYRQLPPPSERKTHPVTAVRLPDPDVDPEGNGDGRPRET